MPVAIRGHRYREDIPDAISQKLRLLQDQEKQISDLRDRLRALQARQTSLETELAPYRLEEPEHPFFARISPINGINRCPDEIWAPYFSFLW